MQKYIETLKLSPLFSGVNDTEISTMLHCLQAKLLLFQKGEYIFREGEHIDKITVLVEGQLLIQHDDFWGNRSIVNIIHAGELFGEASCRIPQGQTCLVIFRQLRTIWRLMRRVLFIRLPVVRRKTP